MTILIIGAICIVAAIVGGGLKGAGFEFPALTSRAAKVLLAGTGVLFLTIGLIQEFSIIDPKGNTSQATVPPNTIASSPTVEIATSTSTSIASSTTDAIAAQVPIKSYRIAAAQGVAINLDNGKQVAWTRSELPAGADLSVGNFKRIGARAGSRLYRLLDDDSVVACRASIERNTAGAWNYLVEDLAKGDVLCTDTDEGRVALLTVVELPRDLYQWTGQDLALGVRLWP